MSQHRHIWRDGDDDTNLGKREIAAALHHGEDIRAA
jgi:hypothetical protein